MYVLSYTALHKTSYILYKTQLQYEALRIHLFSSGGQCTTGASNMATQVLFTVQSTIGMRYYFGEEVRKCSVICRNVDTSVREFYLPQTPHVKAFIYLETILPDTSVLSLTLMNNFLSFYVKHTWFSHSRSLSLSYKYV